MVFYKHIWNIAHRGDQVKTGHDQSLLKLRSRCENLVAIVVRADLDRLESVR